MWILGIHQLVCLLGDNLRHRWHERANPQMVIDLRRINAEYRVGHHADSD